MVNSRCSRGLPVSASRSVKNTPGFEGSVRRFRPVLLTSLTTFGGLAPMIAETSLQARFLIPMAISLGFGVIFVTPITLVLVPAFYRALADARVALHRRLGHGEGAEGERRHAHPGPEAGGASRA